MKNDSLIPINYKTMCSLWDDFQLVKIALAIISASLVDIAISLVAFADGSLLSVPAIASDGPATLNGRSAKKSASLPSVEAKLYRCECGFETPNRYEYSGHARTCETHKAAKSRTKREKLVPVEMPVKEEVRS